MIHVVDVIRKVAPGARSEYLAALERGEPLLREHGIVTPLRLAHFLAQVLHESDGLTIERENLNYKTAARLMQIFGAGNHSAGITWGEASRLLNNPQELAERVYGLGNPRKAAELGNTRPGDGWKYRGAGIMQTTGCANFGRIGKKCGVDLEAHPELVLTAEHALKPALIEWSEGRLNDAADRDDIITITRRINGGLNGLDSRREWFRRVRPLTNLVSFGSAESAPPPPPITAPDQTASDRLAARVIAAMERSKYPIDRALGCVNIIYVEGLNPDGTRNDDAPNQWNDLRLVITFDSLGTPHIQGSWRATTEPGKYYTDNPLNAGGAARIEFGSYTAWQVGTHRAGTAGAHEALVQTGGKVTVCRDLNKDGLRVGDRRETGMFGINQHWGYDLPVVGQASAGCLVGQSRDGHREFMRVVKSDPRYIADPGFIFPTAILRETDVLAVGSGSTETAKSEAPRSTGVWSWLAGLFKSRA